MTDRLRAVTKASLALVAAAATRHDWVAVPTLLYFLRLVVTEARNRSINLHDQEHPRA